MATDMDHRHYREVEGAYRSARLARRGAFTGLFIGVAAILWTIGAIGLGDLDVAEGVLTIAGAALAASVTSAGLYTASYRTSVGASALERRISES